LIAEPAPFDLTDPLDAIVVAQGARAAITLNNELLLADVMNS